MKSISVEVLPLHVVRRFARKTREYTRAYERADVDTSAHAKIEKFVKERKTHRAAVDLDYKFTHGVYE